MVQDNKCRKCKTKINRSVVYERKVKDKGREFTRRTTIYKEYSCECGNCRFFGDLSKRQIDKQNVFVIYKLPKLFDDGD